MSLRRRSCYYAVKRYAKRRGVQFLKFAFISLVFDCISIFLCPELQLAFVLLGILFGGIAMGFALSLRKAEQLETYAEEG